MVIGTKEIKIVSPGFLKAEQTRENPLQDLNLSRDEWGQSIVHMSYDGKRCAIFVFGDRVRDESSDIIERLNRKKYTTALISGDGEESTRAVGEKLNIKDSHGGMLPQDKAVFIRNRQQKGNKVAMIGDGINDAPALIQSDLAVAVYSGNALNKEVADITLMRGDLSLLLDFLILAKKVNRKVGQNLTGSFIYNLISIPIAMSGLLNPLIAVLAMLLSSLSVIGNTLRLVREKSPMERELLL